ncbi:MAG: hypothetical protein ACP5I3_10405 [Thermoproteus sp.]
MPVSLKKPAQTSQELPQDAVEVQEVQTEVPAQPVQELPKERCISVPEDVWKALVLVRELGADDETIEFVRKKFGSRLKDQIPEELALLIRILS